MRKIIFIVLYLLLINNQLFAQHEADFWYFGNNAGIDFSSGNPEPLINGQLKNYEGCAVISDSVGNLLFYTNGITVWNKQHLIMQNGDGLFGDSSSTQSAIVIPKPKSDSIFYIFTTDVLYKDGLPEYIHKGLNYSIVNMNRNAGLGEIIQKNTLLLDTVTEKITAVKHKNGKDIWLITHKWGNNDFYCRLITKDGLQNIVISSVGTIHAGADPYFVASIGNLKASADGSKIVVAMLGLSRYEVFDFDNETGIISNPLILDFALTAYGCEFSPNCSKLYMTNHYKLVQADLNAGTSADIINSLTDVYEFESIVGSLQLANNGKLYITNDTVDYLSVINYPDSIVPTCGFENNAVFLEEKKARLGLPNFIQSYFKKSSFNYRNICIHDTTFFSIESIANIDSVLWNFDDENSNLFNTSNNINPFHIFTETGVYNVKLTVWYNDIASIYSDKIKIISLPKINLGKDTTFCNTSNYIINAYSKHLNYIWNTASTDSAILVNQSNSYWCTVENVYTGCKNSDTINIIFSNIPEIELGNDTSFCKNTSFNIDAFHTGYSYIWQDNSTNSCFKTDTAGVFLVRVKNSDACENSDTIILSIKYIPRFAFIKDTIICENSSFILAPNLDADVEYIWQDESKETSFLVNNEGVYKLTSSNICGNWSDSINVATRYCGDIYIPNVFTPTNDGVNELFKIKGIEYDVWDLKIYSRWGELVFHASDYKNEWNGGSLSPTVYYYILSNFKNNTIYKGTVRIVRAKK